MNDSARSFLFDLLNTPSPSGFESAGQQKWSQYVNNIADSVESDTYGTAWATLKGQGGDASPSVMIEAHADEIGFMVNHISEEGYLYITRIGGSDRATSRGKRVQVMGSKGPIAGVIGNTAIHIRDTKNEKIPELHELFVDIGVDNIKEVEERGIRVGHPIVFADSVEELLPGKLTGRALDNRIGSFIIAEVLQIVAAGDSIPATLYAVNAVQEEIGGHGAKMIAYRLKPTVAVVLDVTHATDSPGIEKTKHGSIKMGAGPSITHGMANHVKVVERLQEVATDSEIPIQHEATSSFTGTDTDDIFNTRSGVPTALISLPMRYMHSTIETVDLKDVEECIKLLTAFVRSVGVDDKFQVEVL